jgi:diguanylate cyclase (GGDEF)-like protein
LDDAAAVAFALAASRGPVTAVTFDVNKLKEVNDSAGHGAGDRLLTQIGALLQMHYADLHGSLVARVGGDEFTVLVPFHNPSAVMMAAERACLAARELPNGAGLSCGVATTTDRGAEAARHLFKAADVAQYEAKRTERLGPVAAMHPYSHQAFTR